MNGEQDGFQVMTVGRGKASGSCPMARFGFSCVGTSGSGTTNSQLIVARTHYTAISIYINGTDDKIELERALQTLICTESFYRKTKYGRAGRCATIDVKPKQTDGRSKSFQRTD